MKVPAQCVPYWTLAFICVIPKTGDLLMIDEPELNLHPENQCRMARLFARWSIWVSRLRDHAQRLYCHGTQHLIMLNQDKPYLKQIAEKKLTRRRAYIC